MATTPARSDDRIRSRSGMTLLEVILAVAVTAFLLSAATSFVVSVSSIWLEREDRNFFQDHVDGVMEFLHGSFARAGTGITVASEETGGRDSGGGREPADDPPEPTGETDGEDGEGITNPLDETGGRGATDGGEEAAPSGGLLQQSGAPVEFSSPPGFGAYRDPLLHFRTSGASPLLVAPDSAPSQFIESYLYFEPGEGLSLLWSSNLQEEVDDLRDLRRTEISRWVSALRYVYWDERLERWEEEDEPKQGDGDDLLLPRFLKIEFTYGEEVRERLVALPVPSTAIPLF